MNNREARFRPQLPGGVPATIADSAGPVYLIVIVAESGAADVLAAAATQARGAGARLLIALARPRLGFTTDAALVRFVTARRNLEMLWLQRLGHQVLDPAGVTFETVLMTYRGGGSEYGRTRRLASALERLARGRGAIRRPATGAVLASSSRENHQ
ncbi:hypothetical protein [Pseudarthrobacter raffinosi]|uniref:hypothetical protein n=1 Tax=Pseudarthrobacter raffinosi TaxID=2953651 RepID=UPI00208E71AE|nr:hypothetical protein [Pseudarthrobacter sp. MDT3-28]MCO4239594.1 hypothetical protein [Pseudarthrobacter sp. MDT3-28]